MPSTPTPSSGEATPVHACTHTNTRTHTHTYTHIPSHTHELKCMHTHQVKRESSINRRKGMPSGCKSLVPDGYKPPHPKHKQLFDGKIEGRELNVKNFYRHFCTFQDTAFNAGAVAALEDCGEYKVIILKSQL